MRAPLNPENDPETVIFAIRGVRELGVIDTVAAAAAGVPDGEIVLLNGYPGPKGWGGATSPAILIGLS